MTKHELPELLRFIANEIEGTKPHSYWDCWLMVLNEMKAGNPAMREPKVGKSSFEAVREELQRLYAIDQTVRGLK